MEVNSWISGLPKGGGAIPWLAMAGTAAIAASPLGRIVFSVAGKFAAKLAKNTTAAVLTVAMIGLALTAAISILVDFPDPAVHDEFCYVLAGQTFAHLCDSRSDLSVEISTRTGIGFGNRNCPGE